MRNAEHELSQDESALEITPLPPEKDVLETQSFSPGMEHQSVASMERAHRSSNKRYILTAVVLCLGLALFLATVVVQRHELQQPSSHAGSLATSSTLIPTATPASSYVPTDYSVNTTIENGVVYAGAANGAVYALRASDGKVIWRHKIDLGASTSPLVNSGIVYITANISDVGPSTLYALRASDGAELWRYTSKDTLSAALLNNGLVYVTSYDVVSQNGSLVAFRARDGIQLWHDTARGLSYNTPIVDNQIVYVSAYADNGSGMVYALQANNGIQIWHYTTTTLHHLTLSGQ